MSQTTETAQIPVIDISGDLPEAEVGRALVDAAATYGFVYVKNEGKDIPVAAIDRMFELSKKFFSSPVEEKEECKITENNRGWSGMHTETLSKEQRVGDFKEALNFGEFKDGKPQQVLPLSLAEHESELAAFQKSCHDLVLKILTLFGIGLEIPASSGGSTWFTTRHTGGPSGTTLRLLYYPHIPPSSSYQPAVDVRAGAHSDYGSITLLFQRAGQPGLELLPPGPNPSFTPVAIRPPGTLLDPAPPIVVNIGDLLSYWTNGVFRSTVHRVVFPPGGSGGEDRYSMAYFGHPVGTTVLEPVPSERVRAAGQDGGSKAKAMTANEHLMSRLKATYLGLYQDKEKDGST